MTETRTASSPQVTPTTGSAGLVLEEAHKFRVHTRAYNDRAVFDAEMRNIFDRVWIFVGHTSEIPNPGDYKTSYIGMQPVIVVRTDNGDVNVLVNRCVHRGAVVCREMRGNARQFECPYHGWVYQNDGKLLAIPHAKEAGGYSEHFDKPAGLFKVPKVDMFRGLIFACMDPDVVSLDEFLGRAKLLLERRFNLSPSGEIVFRSRPFVSRYKGNWKFQAENIVDDYHFVFTHTAFIDLQAKYGDATGNFGLHPGGSASEMKKSRYRGNVWGVDQGHGILDAPALSPESFLNGRFGDYYKAIQDKVGEEEFKWVVGRGIGCIFPNLGIIHQQIRTWRPIAPDLTEVVIYPFELKGAPDEFNQGMLHAQERFYAPSGYGAPDDVEMFASNQHGLEGHAVDWLLLERGVDTDEKQPNGDYRGQPSSEACQRSYWRQWNRLMTKSAGA
jgi:phenylpropionate dioxygenase-like ring-hydroxylating dioxygenase large terminal subunit